MIEVALQMYLEYEIKLTICRFDTLANMIENPCPRSFISTRKSTTKTGKVLYCFHFLADLFQSPKMKLKQWKSKATLDAYLFNYLFFTFNFFTHFPPNQFVDRTRSFCLQGCKFSNYTTNSGLHDVQILALLFIFSPFWRLLARIHTLFHAFFLQSAYIRGLVIFALELLVWAW